MGTRRRRPRDLDRGDMDVAQLLTMGDPGNPRHMAPEDMAALRRSIREFGFVDPVIVNRRSSRIVGGHQRVTAAEAEGLHTVPVVWVNLSPTEERQLSIALNRIAGDWDDDLLCAALRELADADADLSLTGFAEQELAELLAEAVEAEPEQRAPSTRFEHECPECGHTWTTGGRGASE